MLKTEERNPKTTHIDQMSTVEMLRAINDENFNAVRAVDKAISSISQAVDAISAAFASGGRLFYMGAGTSGRLAVLDAAECPPTFGVSPDQVIALLAGGSEAMVKGNEQFEDSREAPIADLKSHNLNEKDIVVGISAAGGAMYVISGMEYAKSLGCMTIGITANENTLVNQISDISIVTDTGPEVITGSTRMKAGTAQKLVLNMLSTCTMIKRGYVYENLMINVQPSNIKLQDRMVRILCEITQNSYEDSKALLEKTCWNIRRAIAANESEAKQIFSFGHSRQI